MSVSYDVFVGCLEKNGINTTNLKYPETEKSKMKKIKVTPFVIERCIKYCIGWDEFVYKCQTPGEANPITAVVNTSSRVSPDIVTKDSMPPREAKNAPYTGQATFGAFYIISKKGYVLTTLKVSNDDVYDVSYLVGAIPSGNSMEEWTFGKLSTIQHSNTKMCVGLMEDDDPVKGARPCLTMEGDVVTQKQKWRLNANGTISCAACKELVLEITPEVIYGKRLVVRLMPYREGASEQVFKIVNYAPAYSGALKPGYVPMPGDTKEFSPVPYTDDDLKFYRKNYPIITTNY